MMSPTLPPHDQIPRISKLRDVLRRVLLLLLCFMVCTGGLAAEVLNPEPIGLWWVSHGDGEPLQFRLYADGSAWSDYPENNPGQWSQDGLKVTCIWADDWKEVLVWTGREWQKFGFAPGQSLDSPPSNFSRAHRVSSRPDGWFGGEPR